MKEAGVVEVVAVFVLFIKSCPKVMILMGLPGSYVIATNNSYVGSLVEMAGGEM